jgi:hypothetical protein
MHRTNTHRTLRKDPEQAEHLDGWRRTPQAGKYRVGVGAQLPVGIMQSGLRSYLPPVALLHARFGA